MPEETQHSGHTMAQSIIAQIQQHLNDHIGEVMQDLEELEPKKIKVSFGAVIDLTEPRAAVKVEMSWATKVKFTSQAIMDDPDQGTFDLIDADTGQGPSDATQNFVDAIQKGAASATITAGGESVTIPAKRKPKEKADPVVPEATHYPDIKIAEKA